MPSHALQTFVRAFTGLTTTSYSLPVFLIPAVANIPLSSYPLIELHRRGRQRNVSSSSPAPRSFDTLPSFDSEKPTINSGPEPMVSYGYRKKPRAWADLIEAYLPLHLRQEGQNVVKTLAQFTSLQSIHSLPLLLSKARSYAKVDLLSYLGVFQGRWDAVMWLIKAMMEDYPDDLQEQAEARKLPKVVWPPIGQSLDAITGHAVDTVFPQQSRISLDSLTQNEYHKYRNPSVSSGRQSLGQVWQTLGTMILQAADRSADDPTYSDIMSHVFQILAYLHHIEAFPNSIYNYTPAEDHTVVQRPPTLHLLSRRIMSTLSDLEWGIQWQAEILKYQKLGYDLPKATVPPKFREFGPELWLDLVLWACVEGGFILEGAWIVTEMERRKGSKSTRWSVISWRDVCEHNEPKLDWPSIIKLQIERTTLNQVGGIGIATGPDSTVQMGERTVSREVILAMMDGLLNIPSPSPLSAQTSILNTAIQSIEACRNLLERRYPHLDSNFLNGNISRIMESLSQDFAPGLLQRLLNPRDLKPQAVPAKPSSSPIAQSSNVDDTAARLGLLHRSLRSFAQEDNVQGSLEMFNQIQMVVDQKRNICMEDFADELENRTGQDDDITDPDFNGESDTPAIHPQIPVNALTALVDLITNSKNYDLGRWLLLNDDIDGGAVDSELYSDPNMQPALLRFANAAAESNVLTKVLERLEAPLSEPILHALLRCETALGRWDAVEDLLDHFQKTRGMCWLASDATAIATAIIHMEHSRRDATTQEQLARAHGLLYNLINGRYNITRDPSQPHDFSQIRLANQLGRIFRSLPGSLSKISADKIESKLNTNESDNTERADANINITPNAFNLILETIVDYHGPKAGKQLWERWCRDPGEVKLSRYIRKSPTNSDDNVEKVVIPTLYMLRNILQPIVLNRQRRVPAPYGEVKSDANNRQAETNVNLSFPPDSDARVIAERQVDQGILDWGIRMYEKFGLSEKAINKEIPGSFYHFRKEKLGDVAVNK